MCVFAELNATHRERCAEFERDPRNSANASLRIGIQESVLLSSILILKSYSTCG
ncbi:hypothetical protein LEP1GSC021_2851 [Leptospira noguchii str. 1993005606]|nr:hypothetical protein LEP1GSC170_2255 [Leptospira interrogans serovar Bataviae str. HAI135]EPE85117.1 hypothetical protein LEP1GSC021_2851 [Leptospira noguchii str. 1993005606]